MAGRKSPPRTLLSPGPPRSSPRPRSRPWRDTSRVPIVISRRPLPRLSPTLRTTRNPYVDFELQAREGDPRRRENNRRKVLTEANQRWKTWPAAEVEELNAHFERLRELEGSLNIIEKLYAEILRADHNIMTIMSESREPGWLSARELEKLSESVAGWTYEGNNKEPLDLVRQVRSTFVKWTTAHTDTLQALMEEWNWLWGFLDSHGCSREAIDKAAAEENMATGRYQVLMYGLQIMIEPGKVPGGMLRRVAPEKPGLSEASLGLLSLAALTLLLGTGAAIRYAEEVKGFLHELSQAGLRLHRAWGLA